MFGHHHPIRYGDLIEVQTSITSRDCAGTFKQAVYAGKANLTHLCIEQWVTIPPQ